MEVSSNSQLIAPFCENDRRSCVIKLQNLKDGEIVRHSIVLVRGAVDLCEECSTRSTNAEISICFGNSKKLSEPISESGEFKFILDLTAAYDAHTEQEELLAIQLEFSYCTAPCCIRIFLEHSKSLYRLQALYILCRDEEDSPSTQTNCQIIDVNLRLVQALYADRIREAGFPPATFTLNKDCEIFRSDISLADAWNADEQTLWQYFAEELIKRKYFDVTLGIELKIVAFISCTKYCGSAVVSSGDYSYANIRRNLKAHAALGGGNLALFGSAFFYAWPKTVDEIGSCLRNSKPVDLSIEPDESNYRRTCSGVYATTLGAICHELGHVFDLGHTSDGIMGSGFDFLNRVLITASRTENLPRRIVETTSKIIQTNTATTKPHFTKLQSHKNTFLDNYRDQKVNDGFFFSRNSAVVLAHHKWLKNHKDQEPLDECINIKFDEETGTVLSDSEPLKIIEIRSNSDSLTKEFFEFQVSPTIFSFKLPARTIAKCQKSHLFVMTIGGNITQLRPQMLV